MAKNLFDGKRICFVSLGHIVSDVRLHHRLGLSLKNAGYTLFFLVRHFAGQENKGALNGISYKSIVFSRIRIIGTFLNLLAIPRFFVHMFFMKMDLIICFEMRTLGISLLIGRIKNIPVIYDIHEYRPEMFAEHFPKLLYRILKSTYHFFEKWLVKKVDFVWAVNGHMAERFTNISKNILIVPNYPPKLSFSNVSHPLPQYLLNCISNKSILLYMGGITKVRGAEYCILMAAQLKELIPDIKIILVGNISEDYRIELTERISELDLINEVEILDPIPYHLIPALLKKSTLGLFLLQPGKERYNWGEPIKYLEYSAAGLPVVMTNRPSLSDLINKYGNGIIVESDDEISASIEIANLLRNQALMNRMGKLGREMFIKQLNWDAISKDVIWSVNSIFEQHS